MALPSLVPVRRAFVAAGLLLGLAPLLAACALAVNGLTQTIPVRSTPTNAEVFVDGELRGVTPMELVLRRGDTVAVTVRHGGEERTVVLTSRANGTLVAVTAAPGVLAAAATLSTCVYNEHNSELFCPLFALGTLLVASPLAVDAATGAWYEFSPNEIVVTFD
jgi:hypothetical protein